MYKTSIVFIVLLGDFPGVQRVLSSWWRPATTAASAHMISIGPDSWFSHNIDFTTIHHRHVQPVCQDRRRRGRRTPSYSFTSSQVRGKWGGGSCWENSPRQGRVSGLSDSSTGRTELRIVLQISLELTQSQNYENTKHCHLTHFPSQGYTTWHTQANCSVSCDH